MTREPEEIPAVPEPAKARPTIKDTDDGATAVVRLPSSKSATAPGRSQYGKEREQKKRLDAWENHSIGSPRKVVLMSNEW